MDYFVSKDTEFIEVENRLDKQKTKIVYIWDDNHKVIGSITDGDVRRYIMKNGHIATYAYECMHSPCHTCTSIAEGKEIIKKLQLVNIPLVDNNGVFIEMISLSTPNQVSEKVDSSFEDVRVVMMAGGKGERLYPYTSVLPKPLIPISGIPIAERILNRFKEVNITKFILSLNYKRNLIKTYFEEAMPSCTFEYVVEDEPLGTGGSLTLMKDKVSDIFIVVNCDMLINVNINQLLKYHQQKGALITIVGAKKQIEIPYGVIEKEGSFVSCMEEKPTIEKLINTGMYVVSKDVYNYLPSMNKFHMTHVVENALEMNQKVAVFEIDENDFMDMGVMDELKNMNEKVS